MGMDKSGFGFVSPRVLDWVERVAVAALYAYFVVNIVLSISPSNAAIGVLLLAGESSITAFTLVRRSTRDVTVQPLDWALGFAGTTLPLLVRPNDAPLISPSLILGVMLCGAVLQIAAKLFLRRSFGIVAANRGVKIAGPYRVIRHPMYAGYMLTELGFLLGNPTAWNLAVYTLGWACQLGRILAEEHLLLRDQAYQVMVERVPYRLIPGVF
jgi:protein-S-isoprenylcysteine O-methyltransferase Ste14